MNVQEKQDDRNNDKKQESPDKGTRLNMWGEPDVHREYNPQFPHMMTLIQLKKPSRRAHD